MKTVGVKDYTNQTPSKNFTEKMSDHPPPPPKMSKNHEICINGRSCENNYAKFEYKGMKTVVVTDYTNQTPP